MAEELYRRRSTTRRVATGDQPHDPKPRSAGLGAVADRPTRSVSSTEGVSVSFKVLLPLRQVRSGDKLVAAKNQR